MPQRNGDQLGQPRTAVVPNVAVGQASSPALDEAVLYLCAFVVSVTAVWAVTLTTDDPALQRAFVRALVVGFAVSWWLRRYERLRGYGLAWTAGLMLAALLWYRATGTLLGQDVDALVGSQRQGRLVLTLAAVTILRSYGLLQLGDLLFCVVPGLAIFGLVGTEAFDPWFTFAFLLFVFAAAYLAGQAHLMAERERSRLPSGQDARRVARERLVILALLFVLSAGLAVPASRAAALLIPESSIPDTAPPPELIEAAGAVPQVTGRPLWSSSRALPVGAGPIRLGRGLVMRVKCEEPLLWRANSLSRYTGNGWDAPAAAGGQKAAPSAGLAAGADGTIDLRPVINAPAGRLVKQEFQFQSLPSEVVFAAMQPAQVKPSPGSFFPPAVSVDPAGSLSTAGRLVHPDASYEVVSQLTNLVARAGARSVLAADDRELLRLPNSARDVSRYAREAVGDIVRPDAQVRAIVSYLRAKATYSLDAAATPPGEDAVIHFLARSRTGYCDLFASAAALMCRALGIPARVAVGYAPGEHDPAAGVYIVRESDAHAWAEVYLPQQGWITVDPTPPAAEAAPTPLPPPARLQHWLVGVADMVRARALYLLAGLAVLAWAGRAIKARWLDDYLALRRRERSLRAEDHRGSVLLCYEKVVRALERRGLPRRAWETPNEYTRRLGKRAYLTVLMPTVVGITRDYLVARFSEREVSGEQARSARAALQEVAEKLHGIKRLQ